LGQGQEMKAVTQSEGARAGAVEQSSKRSLTNTYVEAIRSEMEVHQTKTLTCVTPLCSLRCNNHNGKLQTYYKNNKEMEMT
jgi:hypothetical protein